jgi:outer membrane lipoprotein
MAPSLLVVKRGWHRLLPLVLLAGCAGAPQMPPNPGPEPAQAAAEPERWRGRQVVWAGTLVAVHNLAETSRLEVLAYPRRNNGDPDLDSAPLGRFVASYPGYLEPLDYAPGRLLGVRGRLAGSETGRVGDAQYRYPLVEADQLQLLKPGSRSEPRVYIGVGSYHW